MISVIIPTYNRKILLKKSLESVLNQTVQDLEVIIVDDCSDDGTYEYYCNYPDNRVRCLRLNERSGACVARNTGIAHAEGDYIAFQDSDDIWYPNKLENQLRCLEETNADIVFCTLERFIDGVKTAPYITRLKQGFIKYEDLMPSNIISTQTILGKATCFKNTLFNPKMKRVQDWELAFRLVQKYRIFFLDEILVSAYIQNDSITKNKSVSFESGMYIYNKYIYPHINPKLDLTMFLLNEGYNHAISELKELKKKYSEVSSNYQKLQKDLSSIQNSKIWIITRPYRRIMDQIRSVLK